jgi:hypothetical protein
MATVAESDKMERIRHEFDRKVPATGAIDDISAFYQWLTAEWLTAILSRRHGEIELAGYTLDLADSGMTNRRQIFLHYARDAQGQGYSSSLFCKVAQHLLDGMTMPSGSAKGEVDFYKILRSQIELEVPEALFAAIDPIAYRAIVITTWAMMWISAAIARHDARLRRKPALCARQDTPAVLRSRFRAEPAGQLADPFRPGRALPRPSLVLLDRVGGSGTGGAARIARSHRALWSRRLDSVARMDHLPVTLTHGDDHLGNWYVRTDKPMGLTDFQSINRGHWSGEVAYAIAMALTVEHRRAWVRDSSPSTSITRGIMAAALGRSSKAGLIAAGRCCLVDGGAHSIQNHGPGDEGSRNYALLHTDDRARGRQSPVA